MTLQPPERSTSVPLDPTGGLGSPQSNRLDGSREDASSIVVLSRSTSDAALPQLARRLGAEMNPRSIAVLDFRIDRTLAAVGSVFRVSRERVRQLEEKARARLGPIVATWVQPCERLWATQLEGMAVSEDDLFAALRDPAIDLDSQNRLARLALTTRFPSAAHPTTFRGGVLPGWWSTDPASLQRSLRTISRSCPIADSELDDYLLRANVPPRLPARTVLQAVGSPMRYYPRVKAWVRSRASHRDAGVAALNEEGRPLSPSDLASRLGLTPTVLNANLSRDWRVRQVRPRGMWTLVDWMNEEESAAEFASTVDAVVAVLTEHGPLARKELVRRVIDVYPVSAWAVVNALESDRVGVTPSGEWDLAERGALPARLAAPAKPRYVIETPDGRVLSFVRLVDSDLLRGSGLPVSTYIGWRVGLRRPGDKRTFSSMIYPSISIRRSFGSCSISSLREQARDVAATLGDSILITLELSANEYHLRLVRPERHI